MSAMLFKKEFFTFCRTANTIVPQIKRSIFCCQGEMPDVHCLLVNYFLATIFKQQSLFPANQRFSCNHLSVSFMPPLKLFISIAWMAAVRQNHKEANIYKKIHH